MRRLIAYITMATALVFGVAVNSLQPLKNIIPNLEYQSGREFVYRIEEKDEDQGVPEEALDEVAELMDKRMQTYGVSEYNIAKEGDNIIRTTTALQTDRDYNRLQVFLNYNANFTIKIGDDDNTEAILPAEDIFDGVNARVEFRRAYPFIIFPLTNPELFKTNIVNVAQDIQAELETPGEDGAQADLVKAATIVLWSDYDPDADSYLNPQGKTAGKIFLEFDYRSMWWDEDHTEIGVISSPQGETQDFTTSQIREATETAFYMANLFNAGPLDYKVEFLFQNAVYGPTVEPLITLGNRDSIALSATLFAAISAIIITLIISFLIYRLPVLTALSSGALTLLGTLLIFNAVLVEFTTSAIIGLIIVSLVALASVLIYASKFREEVYRGRTFKKAHQEAIRRSTFITLDFLVIMIIVGVLGYFFAGAALAGLSAMLIFGAIVGSVSILLHNSLMLWLLANNTSTQKNYKIYGIKAEEVPNLLAEEKQTYFGRFFAHNPSAKAKLNLGVFSAISLATIVLISVFSGINRNPFNLVKYDQDVTRVYFQVSENSDINISSPTNSPLQILELITIDGEPLEVVKDEEGTAIYETHEMTTFETDLEDELAVTYTFYVYMLKGNFSNDDFVEYKLSPDDATVSTERFLDALLNLVEPHDDKAVISINTVMKEAITPRFERISLIALLSLVLTSVYLSLRYGLSRGVANFVESLATASTVLLFFIVTRIAVPPIVTLGALIAVLFVSFLNVIVFNKINDVKTDQQYRELTRREHYEVSLRLSLSLLYVLTLIFAAAFLTFTLLAPLVVSAVYVSSFLAIIVALLVQSKLSTMLIASSVNAQGRLSKIRLPRTKKRKESDKQKQRTSPRSSEPEEAIYIGIND
ncbi:MAG TPA: hypothetical protein VFD05_01145 [Bacilli bacterium]|nr:hypothetical protein [Bacilli bacterium]